MTKSRFLLTAEEPPPHEEPPPGDGPKRRAQIILPPPQDPMAVARVFVAKACLTDDGLYKLRHWRGGWWVWRTSHWVEVEDRAVRSLLYSFTEHAVYVFGFDFVLAKWAPNRGKIGDLLEALAAICILPADRDQPSWLDDRTTGVIVSVANGLLDVEGRQLLPHTPQFFNQTSVPFDFVPDAPPPIRWLKFHQELWPDDPDPPKVLGEWFGYVISGRLDLHKIFVNIGPTRSGKGVIARILGNLVGRKNVAGPTLKSLGQKWGLMPLISKVLAVISDARFRGKDSDDAVVEYLLSISGEDTLTVDRKYKDQWTGKLPCRLHIISNELPKLGDASMAVVGRIVLLPMTRSWLGKEDLTLEPALQRELSGIWNWALDGLSRLTKNGNRFTHLPSADEAITAMRDIASPVGAFIRERCVLEGDREVAVDALYSDYRIWCDNNELPKADKHVFGRNLRAAAPSIIKRRPKGETDRGHVYAGIGFRTAADDKADEKAEKE
jgi:putative DNA primase/helicase